MNRRWIALAPLTLSLLTGWAAAPTQAQRPAREREEKKQTEDKKQAEDRVRQADEAARRQKAAEEAAQRDRERKVLEARQAEVKRQAEDAARKAQPPSAPPASTLTKPEPPARKPDPPTRQDPPAGPVKPTPPAPDNRQREERTQATPKPAPPVRRKPPMYYVSHPQGIFAIDDTFQRYPVFASNRVYDNRPVYCPEVRRVAFVAVEADRRTIHSVDMEGGDERRITDPGWGEAYQPSWSPDGRYLAFVSDRDGDDAVYVTDIQRNTTRLVTPGFGRCMQPVWHPSGKYLVFVSDRDTGYPTLYKVSPWSGSPMPLSGVPAGPICDPTISPDGKTLAFSIHRWEDRSDVYTYDLGWLSGMRRVCSMKGRAIRPAFAPDSFRLFFESRGDLWSVKRLGGDMRNHGRLDQP